MIRDLSYNLKVILDRVVTVNKSDLSNDEEWVTNYCNQNILTKGINREIREKRSLNIQKSLRPKRSNYCKFCTGCTGVKKAVNKGVQLMKLCDTSQTINKNKSTNKEIMCHNVKFDRQCKVIIENVNITELIKKSDVSKINKQLMKCGTSQTVNENRIPNRERKVYHDAKLKSQCKVIIEKVDITEFLTKSNSNKIDTGQKKTDCTKSSPPKSTLSEVQDKISSNVERSLNETMKSTTSEQDVSTPAPAKSLRKQVKPNYAELTLDTSQEKTPDVLRQVATTKVPVYRQQIEDKQPKKPNNLYDFDESDSDRDLKAKKGKGKSKKLNDLSFTIPRAKKVRPRVKRKAKTLKVLSPPRKYDDTIQKILHKVMGKIDHQKEAAKDVNETCKATVQNIKMPTVTNHTITSTNRNDNLLQRKYPVPSTVLRELPKNIHTVDINNLSISLNISCNEANIQESVKELEDKSVINENGGHTQLATRVEKSAAETIIESSIAETNKENVTDRGLNPLAISPSAEDIVDESFDEDDDRGSDGHISEQDDSFLDFADDFLSSLSLPRINIISNVIVQQKNNANKRRRPIDKHSPWRFSDIVKRNPHFIMLKNSALPCLKQDLVLDHNQLEKIEEHFSKTPKRVGTPKKSPVQKSILDYVDNPNHDKENVARSSLFDYDDFSPIKIKSAQHDLRNKAKRNILGPIQDNAANILPMTSTPARNNVSFGRFVRRQDEDEIANYFGFDDENGTVPSDVGRPSEAKPFRIKGYPSKKQTKEVVEVREVEDLPSQEPELSQAVDDDAQVRLFEDPEKAPSMSIPSRIYVRKPRRKRLKSVEADEDDHPKKRKKDMMTKAEEAALEDWAEKFNSMCKEIENYNLEIE